MKTFHTLHLSLLISFLFTAFAIIPVSSSGQLAAPYNIEAFIIDDVMAIVEVSWECQPDPDSSFQYYIVKRNGVQVATTSPASATFFSEALSPLGFGTYCYSVSAHYTQGTSAEVTACVDYLGPVLVSTPAFHEYWMHPDEVYTSFHGIMNPGSQTLHYVFPDFTGGAVPPGFISNIGIVEGWVAPYGTIENIPITFSSYGYGPGTYYQDIILETNDPANLLVIIPCTLHVFQAATIAGTVVDYYSSQALAGVRVLAATYETYTLADGSYTLAVDPGVYDLVFTRTGYITYSTPVIAQIPGDTVISDAALMWEASPPQWVTATVDCNEPLPSLVEWEKPARYKEFIQDDGTAEDYFTWPADFGESAVRFTPDNYPASVFAAKLYVGTGAAQAYPFVGAQFELTIYDEGPDGMPGDVLGMYTYTVDHYNWIECNFSLHEISSGDFFVSIKQLDGWPNNSIPIGVDNTAPTTNKSYTRSPGGNWQLSAQQDLMIRASVQQTAPDSMISDYVIALLSDFDPLIGPQAGTHVILNNVSGNSFTDIDFPGYPEAWYAYAVQAHYLDGGTSPYTYSNIIGMDMGKILEIYLNDCNGSIGAGVDVELAGEDFPFELLSGQTDSNGYCMFECTWKGLYMLDIDHPAFQYQSTLLHITTDTIISDTLQPVYFPPRDLRVDEQLNIVRWEEPLVTALLEDFNGANFPAGWQMTSNGQGWFLTTNGASMGFPILPWNSQYICTNDDIASGTALDGSLDYLITPPLDLRGETYSLFFDSFFTGVNGHEATIEYSFDAGDTWSVLESLPALVSYWDHIEVDLSSISGPNVDEAVWIAFHSDDNGASLSGWAVDNVDIHAGALTPLDYNVYLDGSLVAVVDTNAYSFGSLLYGSSHTACISANFPCGISAPACVDFTSNFLRAPDWLKGDSAGNLAVLQWHMDTTSIASGITGYNLYRDSLLIDFIAFTGTNTVQYVDTLPEPICYGYHVSTVYDLALFGLPGNTGESLLTGPEEVCLVFGDFLPLSQDWSSGGFGNWIPGDNWVINGQLGNEQPSAEFTWLPILQDYSSCLTSGAINGVYGETKDDPYQDGQIMLKFDLLLDVVNASGNEFLNVEVWKEGEWVLLEQFNNLTGSMDWQTIDLDITDYALGYIFKVRFMAAGQLSSDILNWNVDNIEVFHYCAPPSDLYANSFGFPEIQLSWSPPEGIGAGCIGSWWHWDNGEYCNAIGLNGGGTFSVASHWDTDMIQIFDGYALTMIRFIPGTDIATTEFTLKVWKGANAETLLYEQALDSVIPGDWNMITLTEPVAIDTSQELWFGYTCVTPDGEYPAAYDCRPGVTGYGDMIKLDTTGWESIYNYGTQFDFNWIIWGFIDYVWDGDGAGLMTENGSDELFMMQKSTRSLLGYNIYIDLQGDDYEFLDFSTDTSYLYEYEGGSDLYFYVTAVYQSCESAASNEAWVWIGVDENSLDDGIKVFPNPTSNRLVIESAQTFNRIQLRDYSGRILYDHKTTGNTFMQLDLSGFDSGIYLLTVETVENSYTQKVVVAR